MALALWLFVMQVWQTSISQVKEVLSTATLGCWTLNICWSDTVLFGLCKPLNLNRKDIKTYQISAALHCTALHITALHCDSL